MIYTSGLYVKVSVELESRGTDRKQTSFGSPSSSSPLLLLPFLLPSFGLTTPGNHDSVVTSLLEAAFVRELLLPDDIESCNVESDLIVPPDVLERVEQMRTEDVQVRSFLLQNVRIGSIREEKGDSDGGGHGERLGGGDKALEEKGGDWKDGRPRCGGIENNLGPRGERELIRTL